MARRDGQGLQIGLIISVILVLLLAVLTFFFWKRSETRGQELASTKTSLQNEQSAARKAVEESQKLKGMLGYGPDATIDEVDKNFQQDMPRLGHGYPDNDRNYRILADRLLTGLRDKNQQLSEKTKLHQQLVDELAAVRKQEQDRVAQALAAQTQAAEDLGKERQKFESERAATLKSLDTVQTELRTKLEQLAQSQSKYSADTGQLREEIQKLQARATELKSQVASFTKETFEVPNGRVTHFDPATKIALLDLGSADGLRRQVQFGVFDADTNLAQAQKKATVEVKRILGDHLAEAHITQSDVANPVLRGDLVYTPLWAPGNRLRFGIVGFTDLDGDETEDRSQLRQLIEATGGQVDADDLQGEEPWKGLSIQTRYLIVGDEPDSNAVSGLGAEVARKRFESWSKMRDRATELGVEMMPLSKLLNFLDYRKTTPVANSRTASGESRMTNFRFQN